MMLRKRITLTNKNTFLTNKCTILAFRINANVLSWFFA